MKKVSALILKRCLFVLAGVFILPIPLIGDFHIESAILVSVIGCFWASWRACDSQQTSSLGDLHQVFTIIGYLYLFGLPLFIVAVITGCFGINGLGFWLLYPGPSVFLGYAIGRFFRICSIPYDRLLAVAFILGIAVVIPMLEFFSFPQVYYFNHVWGGWPGPIYDEVVRVTGSLFFFRFLTLLWILILWFVPGLATNRESRWVVIFSFIALVFSYTQLSGAGIISPGAYLQEQLGGRMETPHFKLFYDVRHYSGDEIRRIALEHEFYLDQITGSLHVAKPDPMHKIESYLYAHPWQKKQLVGAKFTSYVPVWLDQDQLHIAKPQIEHSLHHELVHVVAKQFGNNLIHASWSIGLVEGLAAALARDESSNSTIDQIVASQEPYPSAEEMKQALSFSGFYKGRSGVNYTTMGSFIQYLLNVFPAENLKEAYRKSNLTEAYPDSFDDLIAGWHRMLDKVPVDSLNQLEGHEIFGMPSLFEQSCPHVMSSFAAAMDQYNHYMADRDTTHALTMLDKALQYSDSAELVKSQWAYQHLQAGHIEKVQLEANTKDSSVDLELLYADAFALADKQLQARHYMNEAALRLSRHPDSLFDAAFATRMDSSQWNDYLKLTYQDRLFDSNTFSHLYYRTKIRAIQKAIESEQWTYLENYAGQLLLQPVDLKYFDTYLQIIHYLGYNRSWKLASGWIRKLENIVLRIRYQQRLSEQKQWIKFLEKEKGQVKNSGNFH